MRFTFICSCAEPGEDGVGDYTAGLAAELRRRGHATQILALNDLASSVDRSGERRRFASSLPWARRAEIASAALREFSPDVVSVQFVPYGFHPKGICVEAARVLGRLTADRLTHVMLHELWIGESTEYGWKDRAIGALQKHVVLSLLGSAKPDVIHTSNPAYAALLARNRIAAEVLPLFGSIPIAPAGDLPWLEEKLGFAFADDDRPLVAALFGTMHPQWSADALVAALAGAGHRKLTLVSVGRAGRHGAVILKSLEQRRGIQCVRLGEQAPARISQVLQAADFGIATTPWALIGKSGTAAAMIEHGLPVVVTRDDWRLRRGTTPEPVAEPLLSKLDESFIAQLRSGRPRPQPPGSRVSEVTDQFLARFGCTQPARLLRAA